MDHVQCREWPSSGSNPIGLKWFLSGVSRSGFDVHATSGDRIRGLLGATGGRGNVPDSALELRGAAEGCRAEHGPGTINCEVPCAITAAHPPGPGFPEHAQSVSWKRSTVVLILLRKSVASISVHRPNGGLVYVNLTVIASCSLQFFGANSM
jgi:hypothetical protein